MVLLLLPSKDAVFIPFLNSLHRAPTTPDLFVVSTLDAQVVVESAAAAAIK
jgi:hypothetical protein